jgi:hypothetical protein
MFEVNDFPFGDLPEPQEEDFKPWEQRIAPGMSGGGGGEPESGPGTEPPDRLLQEIQDQDLKDLIDQQTSLVSYPMVDRFTSPSTDLSKNTFTNEEVWRLFVNEQLYDTRRVTLEHFHLFEWFPICPGEYHTPEGQANRRRAHQMMFDTPEGYSYFNPGGKASMLRGGVGAVRLRPRMVSNEAHYFMSVSSNGVCHEGFPVLIPRRFYGQIKPRLLQEGAVPVSVKGEMRYLLDEVPVFFGGRRQIPALYLHVDELDVLPEARREVNRYAISAAISFVGEYENREGVYSTFATFDPARKGDLEKTVTWLEQFYVTETYKGVVITDFDEVQPRFQGAVFGLPELMAGNLDQERVNQFLKTRGISGDTGQPFYLIYKSINTQGGAYIEGDVDTGGGDFIGRDQVRGSD